MGGADRPKREYRFCRRCGIPSGCGTYKLTAKAKDGRGVYSFCMCPGGFVVNASSEKGLLAVNGMSYSKRDGDNANSAIIVSVSPEDYGSPDLPLSGITFQRELEKGLMKPPGEKSRYKNTEIFRRNWSCRGFYQKPPVPNCLLLLRLR